MPLHVKRLTVHSDRFPKPDVYPFHLPMLQGSPAWALASPVTFFCGDNGSGKSTLLQAIARRAGIHIWDGGDRVRAVYNEYEQALAQYISLTWAAEPVPGSFFAAEIFRRFSELLDEWALTDKKVFSYFGNQSLLVQSHGQGHMSFFAHRYRIPGLYLLDEPENALSPAKQLELMRIIQENAFRGSAQFIIATHSPLLLACPGAEIWSFDRVPVRPVAYAETDHYRIYRDFINHPESFLDKG